MKLNWETEIDTPATVAVIGGGAIGIEAALYARFLGYYVLIFEAAKMAQSWRRGAGLPMLVPVGEAVSRLGLAALEAHRPDSPLPNQSDVLTGLEFAEKYLVPLARTDLLSECVHVHSRVASISRLEVRRECATEIQDRADVEFRLVIHSKNRGWFTERADIVLDCSGVSVPRALGPGGGLAVGELEHADWIEPYLVDVGGKFSESYAGKRVLLVGTSHAALTNLLSLVELMRSQPETRITWLVPLEPGMTEPIQWLDRVRATGEIGQQLAAREEVQMALRGTLESVLPLPATGIERMTAGPNGLDVRLQVDENNTLDIQCDRIVAGTGWQADWSHTEALRVGRSATLDRPILELSTQSGSTIDEPDRAASGSIELSDSILTMEPHYYVLGSKSFGLAHDRFTLAQGHQQIRQAFALIGGRSDLDLYRNIQR